MKENNRKILEYSELEKLLGETEVTGITIIDKHVVISGVQENRKDYDATKESIKEIIIRMKQKYQENTKEDYNEVIITERFSCIILHKTKSNPKYFIEIRKNMTNG